MNKRIKELALEAGLVYIMTPDKPYINEDLEKFAELIVRECARCVSQPTIQAAGQTEFSMKILQDVLANDMKAYFGVKDV